MGVCSSCGGHNSKDRLKDKSSRICGQIHLAVGHHVVASNEAGTSIAAPAPIHKTLLNGVKKSPPPVAAIAMANPFPNMNIANPLRGLVSKNRNRYKKDGFNLDLTYITGNIIAMGFPASKVESVYRNHIDDVARLLDQKHPNCYTIYNLCSERSYDKGKFHDRVHTFPFDDHNPPKIELVQDFCQHVHQCLQKYGNVAAVHCKAGKGRTGTMICCYLLHSGMFKTADDALSYYGRVRTQDRKGVTIPSQVRYVRYYESLLRSHSPYVPVGMYIKSMILQPVPIFAGGQGYVCFSISQQTLQPSSGHADESGDDQPPQQQQQQNQKQHHRTQKCTKLYKSGMYEVKKGDSSLVIDLNFCVALIGDIKIEFYNKSKIGRKERQFQFWFNTAFVPKQPPVEDNANVDGGGSAGVGVCEDVNYVLTLKKDELDIVSKKDKQNKVFSADFQVTLLLQKIHKSNWSTTCLHRPSQDTPSESSEAESSEADSTEEGWESVLDLEPTADPRGVGYRILSESELAHSHLPRSLVQQEVNDRDGVAVVDQSDVCNDLSHAH